MEENNKGGSGEKEIDERATYADKREIQEELDMLLDFLSLDVTVFDRPVDPLDMNQCTLFFSMDRFEEILPQKTKKWKDAMEKILKSKYRTQEQRQGPEYEKLCLHVVWDLDSDFGIFDHSEMIEPWKRKGQFDKPESQRTDKKDKKRKM